MDGTLHFFLSRAGVVSIPVTRFTFVVEMIEQVHGNFVLTVVHFGGCLGLGLCTKNGDRLVRHAPQRVLF